MKYISSAKCCVLVFDGMQKLTWSLFTIFDKYSKYKVLEQLVIAQQFLANFVEIFYILCPDTIYKTWEWSNQLYGTP